MSLRAVKVAHVVEALEGGVLTYMRTVLPRLAALGCRVSLVYSPNRNWPGTFDVVSFLSKCGVSVRIVPMSRDIRLAADGMALVKLCEVLSEGRFDVVHTHCSKAGALGRIAARLVGIKAVLHTPHCFAFLRCGGRVRRWTYLNLERLLGRMTLMLLGVSRQEHELATKSQIVPSARSEYLDNPLEDRTGLDRGPSTGRRALLRRSFDIPREAAVVITVCRLVESKGVLTFLRAAELSRTPGAVFLAAGEGELRPRAEKWIRRRGLGDKVRLLGYVDAMDDLYEVADVVVLCSRAEGRPYALLEAMRSGRAIVAASVPGNTGLIRHEITGHLVAPEAGCVAEAVDSLLADEQMRRRYGRNARACVRKFHSPETHAAKLLRIYQRCCGAD